MDADALMDLAGSLRTYQSHKVVAAAPIAAVSPDGSVVTIQMPNGDLRRLVVDHRMFARSLPEPGRAYLVIYPASLTRPEPYVSWSPADAFEDGYKEVRI